MLASSVALAPNPARRRRAPSASVDSRVHVIERARRRRARLHPARTPAACPVRPRTTPPDELSALRARVAELERDPRDGAHGQVHAREPAPRRGLRGVEDSRRQARVGECACETSSRGRRVSDVDVTHHARERFNASRFRIAASRAVIVDDDATARGRTRTPSRRLCRAPSVRAHTRAHTRTRRRTRADARSIDRASSRTARLRASRTRRRRR